MTSNTKDSQTPTPPPEQTVGGELREELLYVIKNYAQEPDDVDVSSSNSGYAEISSVEPFLNDLEALVATHTAKAVEEARMQHITDLSIAVGYCEGSGHPNAYLEARLAALKANIGQGKE